MSAAHKGGPKLSVNLESKPLAIDVANELTPFHDRRFERFGLDRRVVRRGIGECLRRGQRRRIPRTRLRGRAHYFVDTSVPSAQVAYPFHFNSGTITATSGGTTSTTTLPPLAGNPGVTVSPDGVVPSLDLH